MRTAFVEDKVDFEGVDFKVYKVPGPKDAPDVELLTYVPNPAPPSKVHLAIFIFNAQLMQVPALFWIHGGGFIAGDALLDHSRMASITKELGIVVLSTNYRVAPENPFPASIEDCYASLKWAHANASM